MVYQYLVESSLYNSLVGTVQSRCGFIQEKNLRVTQDATSNGDPLFLSSTELCSSLSNWRVVFLHMPKIIIQRLISSGEQTKLDVSKVKEKNIKTKLSKEVRKTYIRQLHDKVVSVGFLGGFLDHFLSSSRVTIANVVGNGLVKEYRFLANNADVLSEPLNVQLFDVNTINLDSARLSVVESLHQTDDR